MEKLKEIFNRHKLTIIVCFSAFVIVSCLSIFFLSAYFISSGKLKGIISNSKQQNQVGPIGTGDEAITNNSDEEVPGSTENDLSQPEPQPLNAETLAVVENILTGIDAINSRKTVGFDYYVTDEEWDFSADVKQDIAQKKLYVDVKKDDVFLWYNCDSDCKKIYYIKEECRYYLGSGYKMYENTEATPDDINEVVGDTCKYKSYRVEDVKADFLNWGLGAEGGDISKGVYNELTGSKKERKTVGGETWTVYTIMNGQDDNSDEYDWPKDIVAEFDTNGMLRKIEFPFNLGYRSINFNEFDKVYNIEFPK